MTPKQVRVKGLDGGWRQGQLDLPYVDPGQDIVIISSAPATGLPEQPFVGTMASKVAFFVRASSAPCTRSRGCLHQILKCVQLIRGSGHHSFDWYSFAPDSNDFERAECVKHCETTRARV